MRQLPLGIRPADRAVFASYYPGPNLEALQQARRMASPEASGVLWLCGPEGVGKTHLLQATCHAAGAAQRPAYVPLAALVEHGPGVLEGLAELDCLCIDDLHVVLGQAPWERAVFSALREVQENGGRVVASATTPPSLQPWSLQDLGSRFAAGVVLQLRPLDEADQQEALRLRARQRGVELPEETLRWLQRRVPRDMRRMYELLDTLDEAALIAQRRLTVPFIRQVLRSNG